MMARIGWLFISILFCTSINAQYYPYKVAAKKDTVAIIKKVGGVNATTIGDIVKLGDTSNINELQVIDTFTMVNDTLRLSISKDGEKYKAVPILGFDKQKADTFQITSNQLRLSIERDGVPFYSVNLLPYLDNTDNQILSISGSNLTISGGNTVTLPISTYTAGTGINITGNVISNTGDLSNSNELQSYSHSGTTSYLNTLSLSGGSFSLLAGTGIGISHNGSGAVTISSSGSNINIYNSNGLLTANRTVGLNGYNLEFNGTGNTYLNCSRVGLFVNSTPYTAFSNSTTGISDGSSNNAAIDGTLWQSFGSGYAGTYYSGFSHGLHTRINSTLAAYKILNCSSGSTATDRFTVFGNGVVRIQGLPNAQCLATNSSGDVVASTFLNQIQTYGHSGTSSYTNTLSIGGGSFSIIAGTNMAISHNGSGVITLNASTGSNTNIYNSNGSLTANRIVSLAGYNMEFNGTGNLYLNNSGRIGLFLNSTPFTAFSNSATGVQDGNANNAAVDGILWQSYGSGYAFTSYSGFSHGLHTRINSTLAAYKILNCSSGSTATDRFTVFGNGVVRIQGLPNAQCLATNSSGDVVASTFPNQIQTYGHSGTSSYTNTLSSGGGSFSLIAGTNITLSHNGSGSVTINASGGGAGWLTTGNAGTNPTSNYLGTTDAQDLSLRTQGAEALRIKVGGMIGQGTTTPSFPYHMYMGGSNGFRRESSGSTIRDSWKISASDFFAEYTTIGVPKATYKLYGSTNFDGGLFIENDCSRSVFGLNFIRFTSHTNTRNDISTTAIKNTLYTDNAGNLMSSPVHCVSQDASTSTVLQTVSKVINVPTSSTVFFGIAAMENNGQVIYLKRNPASVGTGQVKISSSNGTLIDGATEYYLNTTISGVIMVYNSLVPGWFIYGKF